MTPWARLRSLLKSLLARARVEDAMDDELRFHLECRADDLVRSGLARAEAERRARLEFGAVEAYKERCREALGLRILDELNQDVRYALRGFRRNPGFTAVALTTLALGIGANAAMFTVVESVLLRPLPYRDPGRLVMVYSMGSFGPFEWTDGPLADPDILLLRGQEAFSEVASFNTAEAPLTGAGDPTRVSRSEVTAGLFPLLGARPALGRGFVDQDEGNAVAILSDSLWRGRHAADPHVIGRSATIDGMPHTIVGVMPPQFNFPAGARLWTPLRLRPGYRDNALNHAIARLAPGTTPAQATAAVETMLRTGDEHRPAEGDKAKVRVVGLQEAVAGNARRLLLTALGVVGFVLLIACTNMAGLQLARSASRGPEMAIRIALGAGRRRLVRQLLTESVVLAALGGGLGLAVAAAGIPFLRAWIPPVSRSSVISGSSMLPRLEELRVDGVVVGFAGLLSLAGGAAIGLAPALATSRRHVLRPEQTRGSGGPTRGERRTHGALVVLETALVLVLLVGAGLLLKSFWRLQRVDPGFRRDRILTLQVTPPERTHQTVVQKRELYARVLERLSALPAVADVSAVTLLPFGTLSWSGDFAVEGHEHPPVELIVGKPAVSERYFSVMGIPLRQGRVFQDGDRDEAVPVAIVSESVARRCWPGQDPIGLRLTMDDPRQGRWLTVVGVVGDVRQDSLAAETLPMIYVPFRQEPRAFFLGSMSYVMRTESDTGALAGTLRSEVRALDPDLPVERIQTLDRLLTASVAEPRFRTGLVLGVALLALALALVGIYGVMAYEVTRRTAEIGIRRALGASSRSVLWLVLRRTLTLVSIGLTVGLFAAAATTRVLESFLFAVTPLDSGTFAVVSLCLAGAAALASLVPGRRAARVDPATALRCE